MVPRALRPSSRARWLAVALAAALSLGAVGCKARAEVRVDVADDGSGTLRASLVLDREALALVRGPLDEQLAVEDLRQAGWTITYGSARKDGAEVSASREFVGSAGLMAAVRELVGSDGPVRDVSLEVDRGPLRSRYRLDMTGQLDARAMGLRGDEQLAGVLRDSGIDISELEEALTARALEGFELRLAADLPGAAPVERRVARGGSTRLSVTSVPWAWERVALGVLAAALLAMGALLLVASARRRRGGRRGVGPAST